jgi:hypothetical protein
VAIDGNMDFLDVKTNIIELRKDFVSEGIGLQLSGTRLNLLTTEQRDKECVQSYTAAYWFVGIQTQRQRRGF